VTRIEQLADENELLKSELDALRRSAGRVKTQSTDEHAHVLADQTLQLLERLDASIDRHADASSPVDLGVPHLSPPSPPRRVVVPIATPAPPQAKPLPPDYTVSTTRAAQLAGWTFLAGLFVGAILMGWFLR
jgi:hypothetical protein